MNSALLTQVGMLAVFILLMYFMLIRPQRKRDKETRDMRNSLKRGDKVVTIGGIVGHILKVNEDTVIIEVGKDKVRLEMLKSSIGNVIKGGQSVDPESKESKPAKEDKDKEEDNEPAPINRNKKVSPKKLNGKKGSGKASKAEEAVTEKVEETKAAAEEVIENPFEA